MPSAASRPDARDGQGSARLTVLIVNWNRSEYVIANARRLEGWDYPDFEIIVVDNGSDDDQAPALAAMQSVRFIALGENFGPSRARNVGLEAATGKYVLYVDSDALLELDGLSALIERMQADPSIGIAGLKVLNEYSREIDQWIYAEPYSTHGEREFETYSFSAAGALARVEAIREAGGFWDELFMYNAGYRIIYFPGVRLFHCRLPQGRVPSKRYWFYQTRNWIWIFYRYYPPGARTKKIATYIAVYLLKSALQLRLLACLEGLFAGLRRVELIERYGKKLSRERIAQLERLNRRSRLRLQP
jgi:GT2 family glycosyltransferase